MSDTPETDAEYNAYCRIDVEFAQRLERERDEARALAKRAQFSEVPCSEPLPWEDDSHE